MFSKAEINEDAVAEETEKIEKRDLRDRGSKKRNYAQVDGTDAEKTDGNQQKSDEEDFVLDTGPKRTGAGRPRR